jgi:hypothetical protein
MIVVLRGKGKQHCFVNHWCGASSSLLVHADFNSSDCNPANQAIYETTII